ncbi:hypothetical protein I350_05154 [Cryptococcus amylolentus CBS 6273]|uniref:Fungal-type protein kinase domain-containing protein n=1 Tax=Cryptococcus amylolentus CBS 6273 TaxID=1296118 RepID=A0A1E3JUN9_9TREE|nr:hypothetical protein I350_05154 [Cryptococcus amylolentus CBS 6273]
MSEDTSSSASSTTSLSDLSHFSDYSDSSRDHSGSESDSDSDDVPRAFLNLPLECDSALLERDLSKYVTYGCAAPTRPVWPDTGFVGEYYQPVANFLNSTLDVAREAFERSGKEVEYCALDFLFTRQFRWAVYNKRMGPPEYSSGKIARPALVGFKLSDTSLFDDGTQSVNVAHHRVDESNLITYADIDNRNIDHAIFKSSLTGRTAVDAQPNRVAVRSIVFSIEDGTIKAAIAELDLGGIHLTHFHNLRNDGEYDRFRGLLIGMYCAPIDDHGCNRRIRFYADNIGDIRLERFSYSDMAWRGLERYQDKREEEEEPEEDKDPEAGVSVSAPLYDLNDIGESLPPPMKHAEGSTTMVIGPIDDPADPILRWGEEGGELIGTLESLLRPDQALLGVLQFGPRWERATADVRPFGSGYQTLYKGPYMREVVNETNEADASSFTSLADVYAAHGPLDLVKAVLGAIYGFRNVYRVGWLHKQIDVKNITVGPTREFSLYDYNAVTEELVPVKYDIDCLIGDAEEGLCGMLIAYSLKGEKDEEDVDDGDDLGLFSESLCLMANQKYEDVHFFPATQSTIGGLESFLWVLIYVVLRYHTQGGTSDTPDGHLYKALFGRLPKSDANRSEFLAQKGMSKHVFGDGRCLAPLKDLLTPALKFFQYQYSWCLNMMAKEGPETYPWTAEEEISSRDEFVDIFSTFVQEEAVKEGKKPEKLWSPP